MNWLWDHFLALWNIFWLLTFLVILASPFETLGWWAGWSRRREQPQPASPPPEAPLDATFVVYFTGVAGFSGEFLSRRERGFLDRLRARIPDLVVVDDVFPFSANNNPLDGDRVFRWLWIWLQQWRLRIPNNVFDLLIIVRNVAQTLVSADPRYGPVYNLGVAQEVAKSLLRHGYRPHQGVPVNIVAYSGGAQIGVGAAPYLREILGARVRIVSLGGVYTDDPGVAAVEQITDLKGNHDHLMPALGWLLFPGRWRALFFSPWNRARRHGKFRWVDCGPMAHIGGRDYFSAKASLPDGTPFADRIADLMTSIVISR